METKSLNFTIQNSNMFEVQQISHLGTRFCISWVQKLIAHSKTIKPHNAQNSVFRKLSFGPESQKFNIFHPTPLTLSKP